MIGASKILTVSYGTFSCTLEGFDEPFSTMKAIAEYFRDLAADDRYFGAEPPQPDAAMLHRIAEREIQRRVEAKVQDNGVVLRAGDQTPELPAAPAPAAAPAYAPAPVQAETAAERLRRMRAAAPVVAQPMALPADPYEEEGADTLQALLADSTAAAEVQADIPSIALAEDHLPEDEPEFVVAPVATTDVLPEAIAEETLEVAPVVADPVAADPVVEAIAEEPVVDFAPVSEPVDEDVAETAPLVEEADLVEPEVEVEAEGDSVDADALISGLNAELAAEPAPAEVEEVAAEAFEPEAAAVIDTAEDHDAALISSLNAELAAEEPAVEAETADQAAVSGWSNDFADDDWDDEIDLPETQAAPAEVAASAQAEAAVGTPVEATVEEEGPAPDPFDEDEEALLAELDAEAAYDAVPALNDDAIVLTEEDRAEEEPVAGTEAPLEPVEMAAALPDPVAEKLQRARARVIRIRRTEDEPQDAEVVDEVAPEAPRSLLSAEAEAALQAELAALTAEFSVDPADVAEDTLAEPVVASNPRKNLDNAESDEAMDRLLAHANTAMEDEDSRRRQAALSHMKAAVVANEAERKVAGADLSATPTRQEAYRADLEQVVRPARVEPKAGERLTPLVLVSEQRIDRPRGTTSTASLTVAASAPAAPSAGPVVPVRPRRITAGAGLAPRTLPPVVDTQADFADEDDADDLADDVAGENLFVEGENFTDFAERLGAENLADLIEAAGVYCATVLKRPEFPRPLIMRQIAGLPGGAGASRDDVLRGFGQLLRDGRIAKVSRNHFAVTDSSAYLAEAKKIAG